MHENEDVFKLHGVALRSGSYSWGPDFVYGGIDGAITTFAVVAGVEGASLSIPVILILGFANLFADGFSMAVGKYLSDKSSQELYEKIKKIEYEHLKVKTVHEKEEVKEIMRSYGFKGKDLDRAVSVITSNEDVWVDLMMRNEFNLTNENVDPVKGGVTTFISFLLIGIIPLLGYLLRPIFELSQKNTFFVTIFMTLIALFIVGAVKSKFSIRHWFFSGLQTVLIGGAAAGIAYFVGYFLKDLV
ncbi:VIT1/CCC1 transporter family protein [Candidatus Peregrinibacteria bacterium]|nr:VIT1/CCC1 transporter family protein [Candidatus Peregrinibacteria bacterium]